ncbi:sugar ABC transporter ATP-binding protein [Budviciaceae bacterium BWR-B9]|uniref:Sugar ABC transporter ATP-binding protein n=1 Tax=Limnobaculum allomyrinae TaxID=2791986 RepID=A0ABS1IUG9_9GAMM|nr:MULTISPECIES: sugar ABC transporter ATP-binding protein [Limnobaculum]MBK5145389.1 sugar ABC transporter ATP-binding protein [Limnobaculum allomyrinae]MBV7693183.1 sugar ABC transporter ATP-binding protein [Limnobaculum sp. M2-1]
MEPFISLGNISKTFYGVKALDNIALTLLPGEVHCLAGQNGCGKSTLIKIISGVYQPDAGAEITINGKSYSHLSPIDSVKAGIQVIYQDLSLFPNLTVAENIGINQYHHNLLVNKREIRRIAELTIKSIDAQLDLDVTVESLPIAQRQIVAICRALSQEAKLIIMDEPTASLTMQEVKGLLRVVHDLKKRNICVVFVSHRLDEVMEISDRITVLKDGKLVGTYPATEIDNKKLAFLMTGKEFSYAVLPPIQEKDAVALEVKNLCRGQEYNQISFSLHKGEIVAITGLLGAGRTELCLSLFGLTKPDSGEILLEGKSINFASNREAIKAGIGYVSEDRMSTGLVMEQSINDNIISTVLNRLKTPLQLLNRPKADSVVVDLVEQLTIKIGSVNLPVNTLSGGNAQRVAIAKWLAINPKVLILDSPTVGVDIANKAGIYQIISALSQKGIAVLMITDEIDEAFFNSHRILVMRKGEITAEYLPGETTEAALAEVVNG